MKKTFTVTGVALLFAMTAAATEWPKYEAYLGYDFVRFNPNSGFFPSFNANGGSGQFVYNFNKWFGGVADVGAVTKASSVDFPWIKDQRASVGYGYSGHYSSRTRPGS